VTEPLTLAQLARALRTHWVSMLTAGLLTFAAVVAFIVLVAPRYRSEALLRVESKRPDAGLLGSLDEISGMSALGLGRDEVETEIGLLASRRMQDAAIDSLGLEVVVTRPRAGRAGVLVVRAHGESTLDGSLELRRKAGAAWAMTAEWKNDSAALPATVETGRPVRVGPLEFTVIAPDSIAAISLRLRPRFKVRELMDDRLVIRRRSPGAKLIEARYEDRERELAPRVLGVIVDSYLAYARQLERGDAGRTIVELRRATDSVETVLRAADERLKDYQAEARIVAPTEQATLEVKRVAVLRAQLDQVELERDALARLLVLVDERSKGGRDATAYRQLATFPTLIENRGIQDLLAALITLENERAKLRVVRSDENVDVRALSGRIETLERDLRRVGSEYAEALNQQFSEATRALARLTDDLGELPAAEMRYVRLVRDRTLLGETWVIMRKQLKQAELQDLLRLEKVRLVDAPSVPQPKDKVFPRPLVHTVLGAMLALLVAFGVGVARVLWAGPPPRPSAASTATA